MTDQPEILDYEGYAAEARTSRTVKWLGRLVGYVSSIGAIGYSAWLLKSGEADFENVTTAVIIGTVGLGSLAAGKFAAGREQQMLAGVARLEPGQE